MSIVFLLELSHNPNALLPLVVCVMVSDGFVDSSATIPLSPPRSFGAHKPKDLLNTNEATPPMSTQSQKRDETRY